MAQMPVVEEGAEPPPYFPRTLVIALRGHASRDAPRHKWHRLRIQ